MRRSKLMSLVAVIICFSLLVSFDIPVAGTFDSAVLSQATEDKAVDSQPAHIVAEDLTKRTEDTKEFLRSDGSRTLVLYGEPVHYQDNGKWTDIDNTLISSRNKAGENILVNTAGSVGIELPQYFSPKKPVTITKGEYSLGFTLVGTYTEIQNAILASDPDITKGLSEDEKKTTSTILQSAVKYSNVLPGTDFVYTVSSDQLKEAIVISALSKMTSNYSFDITASNLDAVLQKDNSIHFYPKGQMYGEPIFTIPAPFMVDSEGEISYDIGVSFEQTAEFKLTYTPSMEWLSNAKRVWPVTIDPIIQFGYYDTNLRDQQVDSNKFDVNYLSAYIECGRNATYGIERIYMMYQNLPTLTTSDNIIDASIQVYRGTTSTISSQIEVHKVNSTWVDSDLQWNHNMPGYDSKVEDYQVVEDNGWYVWQITDIARGWYAGQNTGMMFKQTDALEQQSGYYKQFYSSEYSYSFRPKLTITFLNNNGVEDYWSFHKYSISHGGSLAVNDFNGNAVFAQAIASTPGTRAPASLGLVFNGAARNTVDTSLGWGKGWRSVYDQKVTYESYGNSPSVNYYAYVDGDGTKHYFYNKSGIWYNEEGLDLTLSPSETIDSTNYITITDKAGNKLVFYVLTHASLPGRLKETRNAINQTVQLTYTRYGSTGPYCISSITDGTSHTITIARGSTTGLIDSVTDPAGRVTDITLDANGYLTNIQFAQEPNEPVYDTDFSYDSNGNLVTATDCDNRRYTVNYTSSTGLPGTIYRVQQVQESDTASTLGHKSVFSYGLRVTTVTDESDLAVKYMFNSLGSCINAVGPDGSAGLATFGNELPGVGTGVNSTRNKPTQISSVQKFVPNKVKNHDFEQTTDWSMIVDPAGDGSVARATDQKYVGSYSLKIVKNSTTNQNYGFQWVTIEKGKTYTLSAYVKTSGVASATYGAVLEASYYNSSGGRVLVHSAPITGTNDWARLSVTFTVPADSTSTNASAAPMLRYATGTAWFDCVQLEEGNVPNRYNLVENADFDYATSGLPNFWTRGTNSNANDIQLTNSQDTNPPLSSDSRYQIEGVFNQSKTLSQTLPITGNSGDLFVVGGWASGYATPLTSLTSQSVARKLSVRVGFYYNGTYNYSTANSSDFNSCIDGWQYTSAQVKAGSDFTSVQVQIIYDAGVSKISFDGIQLYKEPFGSNYVYDENGNIITVVSSSGGSSGAVYSNNNLVTLTLPNQGTQTFTYDGNHRRLSSASAAGVKTKTSYDSTGHLTQVQEGNTAVGSNLTYIQSSSEFDTLTYGGRYLTKTTDPFGNQVNYAYDADRGTNTSITLPNNLVITNNFKAGSDLLNYTEATLTQGVTARSDYTYGNNSRITEIKHNTGGSDVIYGFVYNTLGWLTNVSVGGNYLVTNAYMDYTGLLNSVLYGNGQSISYLYDDYNRLTDVNYNGSTKYKLAYDATGQVGYLKDLVQNKEYYYLSDASGRLSEIRRSDGSYSRYTYDISNSVTSFADAVLGNTHTTSYVYDTDHRMTSLTSGSISETVGYDSTNSINRVMSVTRKYNNATKLETQYAYVAGAPVPSVTPIPTLTSTRVYTVTNSNKTPIYYTYDANGNITSISQGTDLVQYYYDKLSELVRENVSVTGATPYTNVFVYDVGGNIQLKRTYTYQPGDSAPTGTPVDIAYQYNDASWADKLTSYGGVPLTYDAIGNPLSWTDSNGSWTATWSMGRQLATLSAVGKSISYRYGADGIRTQMTVNKGSGDVTTVYNTVGGVVTWEKTGTNPTIFYTYDGNGKLVSLEYKSAIYFYARNAQNDVIGLVDATTGNWVAQYVYDAWGRSLAVMDGSGTPVLETDTSHIANVNPYRYRGYRYDTESCLYYLNSRYYSPTISRFVNSDGIVGNIGSVLSHNMYSYCLNNPASMHDATGTRAMMLETVEATPHHDGVVISTAAGNVPPASIEESLNSGVFRISYVEYVAPKDFEHYENTVLGAEKMAIFTNAEKGVLIGLGIYAYDRLASKIAGAGGMPQVVASLFLFALAGAYVDAMEYADLERCRNTGVIAINYLGGRVTYKQWDSYPYIDFYNDIK